MTIQTPLHAEHQLDQLAGQFAHWRQTRPHPHSPIPSALWAHAVALTAVVPLSRVATQLGPMTGFMQYAPMLPLSTVLRHNVRG